MSIGKVHQLLHGYSNGHRKLVGSLRLSASDDELISRISDLSGPLFGSQDFRPYFTGYPLPSSEYYAVARTWIDSQAPRAGSVLTHTLLVSMEKVGEIEDLQVIFELLGKKPARDAPWRYEEPLSLHRWSPSKPEIAHLDEAAAIDFIDKYFGEGLRPILWLDAPSPEKIVRLIMKDLWPPMRCHFAFCTLSLQLRNLSDRPFDVLFAPSSRLSKHYQLEHANIVDSRPDRSLRTVKERQAQEWQVKFAKAIFFGQSEESSFREEFAELWEHLEPDPTVVSRLYRLQGLGKRVSNSPMAAVGAMDLLGSLAPGQDQAVSCKTQIVLEGIESSRFSPDPEQSLKSLYLIGDRLRQTAFVGLCDTVFQRAADVVSKAAQEAPDAAFEIGKQVMLLEEAAESPYVIGVAKGLAILAKSNPNKLLELTPPLVSIPVLIATEPTIALVYYDMTRDLPEAEGASKELARGLGYVKGEKSRRRIREALLPKVATCGDSTVLRELLRNLPLEDVGTTLDRMEKATDGFSIDTIRQVVGAEISEQYPQATKEWGREKRHWNFGIATVVAASFAHSLQGLEDVLSYNGSDPRQSLLLAAFIDSQGKYRIPEWLQDRLCSDPGVFMKLLTDEIRNIPEACAVTERVLVEVPDIPLVLDDSLFDAVMRFQEAPFREPLVDAAMGRAVAEYIRGSIRKQEFSRWVDSVFGKAWFGKVPYQRLSSLLVQQEETTALGWSRAWSALQQAPDTVYARRHLIIDNLINCLLDTRSGKWPEETFHDWVSIIRRAESVGTRHLHLTLCAQALAYSFKHPELPLSKVVVESFPVVYRYTLARSSSTSLLGSLFYLFSDWDKGKELRRQIVKSFLKSEWPPEDLALAMPDQQTLRKTFKRLRRYSTGDRFIARMLIGLETSKDPKATEMYQALKKMVESPDFDEPWI